MEISRLFLPGKKKRHVWIELDKCYLDFQKRTKVGILGSHSTFPISAGLQPTMWCCILLISVVWAVVWFFRDQQILSNFNDKYVFITGCDTGFGNMLAKKLDKKGFHVLAGCLTQKGADNLDRTSSPNLRTTLIDVTNSESITKAVEWVKAEVGRKGEFFTPSGIKEKTGKYVEPGIELAV